MPKVAQFVSFHIKPEFVPQWNELIKAAVASSAKEPGTKIYNIHVSESDPTHILAYELYTDEAALEAHRKNLDVIAMRSAASEAVVGVPVITKMGAPL